LFNAAARFAEMACLIMASYLVAGLGRLTFSWEKCGGFCAAPVAASCADHPKKALTTAKVSMNPVYRTGRQRFLSAIKGSRAQN
jgi:hypothetical protein